MPKTVEEILNEVDYSLLEKYKPSPETLKYINFCRLVSGESMENKTPMVHLYALDQMFKNNDPTVIMCFRGMGKTTLACELLILYVACFGTMPIKDFGPVKFMLYVGDSIENGVKSLRKNIEYRYQNSPYLQELIPNISIKNVDENGEENDSATVMGRKFTDVRLEFANKRGDHLVVRMYGVLTGIRGAKELGTRPQVALIDDVLTDEDARSDTVIATVESTIHKAVKHALHPRKHKMIWLGTPFNAKDPLYKAVESGAYNVACFPVCEKFPCSREEFKGAWEDRFTYEYVEQAYKEAYALKNVASFNQELMLRITTDEDRLMKESELNWFSRSSVIKNRSGYNFYITTDLATSEKKSADYSVISVWAINSNGDYMLVDGSCKKRLVDEWMDDLFRKVQIYSPLGVGIEVSGQQGGFIRFIQKEMFRRTVYFNLVSSGNSGEPGIRPVGDKFSRFMLFLPQIKLGKLWIAEEMKSSDWYNEFIDEMSKATLNGFKSKHDDVLDTLSMLSSFEVYKPMAKIVEYETEEDRRLFDSTDDKDFSISSNTIF